MLACHRSCSAASLMAYPGPEVIGETGISFCKVLMESRCRRVVHAQLAPVSRPALVRVLSSGLRVLDRVVLARAGLGHAVFVHEAHLSIEIKISSRTYSYSYYYACLFLSVIVKEAWVARVEVA